MIFRSLCPPRLAAIRLGGIKVPHGLELGFQLPTRPVSLEISVKRLDHLDPRGPSLCGLN